MKKSIMEKGDRSVLLYSRKQKCFHIEILADTLGAGCVSLFDKDATDYLPIAFSNDIYVLNCFTEVLRTFRLESEDDNWLDRKGMVKCVEMLEAIYSVCSEDNREDFEAFIYTLKREL